ncbi:MAG: XylR family transcriptional regulator [Kiritimatiellae bacterium]|nr:XylR family transcriptional regulator [Kiritimatiellia bacterium]MDD3544645.1 XylR family transcriptional regulator [Kiritimatiellia bacterium]MDD4623555.1 XylR family transcriptional regulator [Kiritimatiellia bacterium]
MKSRIPQVAILLPLTLKGQRDSLRGILQYVKLHGPWRLYRMEGRPGEQRLLDLKRWGCTGIIAAQCDMQAARLIARVGVPVVVCEPTPPMREADHPFAKLSCTRFDSVACGRMAAEYFINRHYNNFAFVGEPHGLYWSRERGQRFRDTILKAGKSYHAYGELTKAEQRDWAVEQPRLQAWLKTLPKPVAVFAAMDGRGRQVLDACMGANLTVPDEVAVLGVDNDDLICDATFPTMSSIQTNSQQAAYLLAEHLDKLMSGKRPSRRVIPTTPTRVVTRRSSDATVIPDPQVARALEFIWRNAGHQPISVTDVVAQIGASRRFAERHFKSVTGRTILDEIRRVRLERVCTLLAETNLPIGEITRQCCFERESYLARLFKERFGCAMSAFRAASRDI